MKDSVKVGLSLLFLFILYLFALNGRYIYVGEAKLILFDKWTEQIILVKDSYIKNQKQ